MAHIPEKCLIVCAYLLLFFGKVKAWELQLAELHFKGAHLRNFCGVRHSIGSASEKRKHLFLAFKVKFIVGKGNVQPVRQSGIGLDSKQDPLHPCIFPAHIMSVICGGKGDICLHRKPVKGRENFCVLRSGMVLHFNIIVACAENIVV